ncbi:unnamed protein product [Prorocentrum cordatum]|uniref:Peptidase M56 domain-containing protein n=1 Tax=Prorocentrum cordatum TaxID=2364126 RepID=A0ABN9PGB5_9DINO|nr:unnamed protein product [Polarella glacialis]
MIRPRFRGSCSRLHTGPSCCFGGNVLFMIISHVCQRVLSVRVMYVSDRLFFVCSCDTARGMMLFGHKSVAPSQNACRFSWHLLVRVYASTSFVRYALLCVDVSAISSGAMPYLGYRTCCWKPRYVIPTDFQNQRDWYDWSLVLHESWHRRRPQRHEEVLRLSGASFIKPPARPLLYFLVHLNVAFDLSDYPALARQAIDA